VVGCPYEGKVQPERVADVAEQLFNMGCYEISLGDTIGIGTPLDIEKMLEAVAKRMPVTALAGHFHDTYGRALMNIYTSYQFGVRVFDGSVGGLGGCPYAAGASGNGAIEDIVFLMDSLGVETGVDLEKLVDVSAWISGVLQRSPNSKLTASRWAQRATEGLLA
jgi:hydroxymethylglutaryl-CoA lyase